MPFFYLPTRVSVHVCKRMYTAKNGSLKFYVFEWLLCSLNRLKTECLYAIEKDLNTKTVIGKALS